MHTLTTHFRELIRNIKPAPDRLDAARELPPKVRTYLKEHPTFATVDPHSRLVGSYAQHMSVGDVKDVDFLVIVDGDPDENKPEAKALLRDLKRALDGLPKALGYDGFAGIELERARRSVHVYIKGRDFHLDVVPCIAPQGIGEPIYVPDHGFGKWIPSHPVGLIAHLDDVNKDHDRMVKDVGRLLKHYRNQHMASGRTKSYWLVAMVLQEVLAGNIDTSLSLGETFRDLLAAIHARYACLLGRDDDATPNLPDPMLGHNVSWNWKRSHFEMFMRRIEEGRDWASKALDATEKANAIKQWQKVFGDEFFPTDIEAAASRTAMAIQPGGSVGVTASGLLVSTATMSSGTIAVPKTTFHGKE